MYANQFTVYLVQINSTRFDSVLESLSHKFFAVMGSGSCDLVGGWFAS